MQFSLNLHTLTQHIRLPRALARLALRGLSCIEGMLGALLRPLQGSLLELGLSLHGLGERRARFIEAVRDCSGRR